MGQQTSDKNLEFMGPFLPAIGALLWGGLLCLYYKWLGMDTLMGSLSTFLEQITGNLAAQQNALLWERGKLLFGTASFALCIALLWNTVVSYLIIRKQLHDQPKTSNVMGAVMFFFNSLAWLFLLREDLGFGGAAANKMLQILAERGAPVLDITRLANLLAATTITLIIGSVATLLLSRKGELKEAGQRIQAYTLSIYSTGILLGLGIFEIFSLFPWAASTFSFDKDNSVLALARAFPICAGIVFSLLMVLIYLPAALVQHNWLKVQFAKAKKVPPDITLDKWLNQQGLPASPLNIFGSYVAMLLPFGTGMITKLLGA